MSFEELLPYIIATIAIVGAALIVLYSTRLRKRSEEKTLEEHPKLEAAERWRYRIQQSVSSENAKEAKDELRTLSLEREILSDAIRRLYEAHAEGKITEEEREQLAENYKSRMMSVKEAIADNESVVALHELEAMQEDLIKLFDERFDDLNSKIETLRSRIGIETKETIVPTPIPTSIPQMEAEAEEEVESREKEEGATERRKRRKPSARLPSRKTEAEERIDRIRTEVEKVLDRLEQMEVED